MTINIAWVRKVKECEELWIVSDSRLSGNGTVWDQCSKLNILPGNRTFISFAGNTHIAYPIINQIHNTIAAHRKAILGFMDVKEQKVHILKVINNLIKSIDFQVDNIKEGDLKTTEFIFGGYSWVKKKFLIWKLVYVKASGQYESVSAQDIYAYNSCIIAGDITKVAEDLLHKHLLEKENTNFTNTILNISEDILATAMEDIEDKKVLSFSNILKKEIGDIISFENFDKDEMIEALKKINNEVLVTLFVKYKFHDFVFELKQNLSRIDSNFKKNFKNFNMEPFEIVRDLLQKKIIENDDKLNTIGGAPQLIKIYQHSSAEPVGVFWSNDKEVLVEKVSIKQKGKSSLLGRYLEGYENTDLIYMDPFTFEAKRIISNNFWGIDYKELQEEDNLILNIEE